MKTLSISLALLSVLLVDVQGKVGLRVGTPTVPGGVLRTAFRLLAEQAIDMVCFCCKERTSLAVERTGNLVFQNSSVKFGLFHYRYLAGSVQIPLNNKILGVKFS